MNDNNIAHDKQRGDVATNDRTPRRTSETRRLASFSMRDRSWRELVSASSECFPRAASPAVVRRVVLSKIARPYNSDVACDVVLAGAAMIIEHHRKSNDPAQFMSDLAGYVTQIAKQNGQLGQLLVG